MAKLLNTVPGRRKAQLFDSVTSIFYLTCLRVENNKKCRYFSIFKTFSTYGKNVSQFFIYFLLRARGAHETLAVRNKIVFYHQSVWKELLYSLYAIGDKSLKTPSPKTHILLKRLLDDSILRIVALECIFKFWKQPFIPNNI